MFQSSTPEHYARELLYNIQITSLPIDVHRICSQLHINIESVSLNNLGAFILRQGVKKILLSNDMTYKPQIKFTIAHELGHYYLPHHQNLYTCKKEEFLTFRARTMQKERLMNLPVNY